MSKLVLRRKHLYVELPIASEHQQQGQLLADEFVSAIDLEEASSEATDTELQSSFIAFAARKHPEVAAAIDQGFALHPEDAADKPNVYDMIAEQRLTETQAREMLRSFYSQQSVSADPAGGAIVPPRALDATNLLMVFQGPIGFANGGVVSFDEICQLVDTYRPLAASFVATMSEFLCQEAADLQVAHLYPRGFSLMTWVSGGKRPTNAYLNSAPVMWPLVGLAQLVRYVVLYKTLNLTPRQMLERTKVLAGHSHGVAVAGAIAMAGDESQLIAASKTALGTLLLAGCLPQMAIPQPHALPTQQQQQPSDKAEADDIGVPSSMIIVDGVARYITEHVLGKYNDYHKGNAAAQIHIAMSNTDTSFVVSGSTTWLSQFVKIVQSKAAASADGDQENVPFIKRKPQVALKYLPGSVGACHSPHMAPVLSRHLDYARQKGWVFDTAAMLAAVCAPDGKCADIRSLGSSDDPTASIAEYMYTRPVEWPAAMGLSEISCVLDMTSGDEQFQLSKLCLRRCTRQILLGRGVPLVCVDRVSMPSASDAVLRPRSVLYSSTALADLGPADNWQCQYGARLVRTGLADTSSSSSNMDRGSAATGRLYVKNKLLQLFKGLPPVFVGGMFPTTASQDLVVAAARAGFLAEFDIGHIDDRSKLKIQIADLASRLPRGHPIALSGCGASLADAKKWQWQLDAVLELRKTHGLCIAGLGMQNGVIPEVSEAAGFIAQMQQAGLGFIALRPMTAKQIGQVLAIAQQQPDFPVLLQWMGGRSGGRHSFDEFHTTIMAAYAAVRASANVYLVAGAGLGDAQGAASFLTGAWAVEYGARSHMPFDAVMLRSRLMAARESGVAAEIKQLVVQARGLDPGDIMSLHNADLSAGVVSILDNEGNSVHVLDTRAARLCLELSKTVFSQPRDKQLALLLARKQDLVKRLNSDYMRPWFGRKHRNSNGEEQDGSAVVELEDMTYVEVIDRLLEFAYDKANGRWVHPSLRALLAKFVHRANQRLLASMVENPQTVPISAIHDPVLDEVTNMKLNYPPVHTQLLATEDVDYFISLCARPEQTVPVPFVPVINDDFAWYLMRDCFSQCADVDAPIVERDVQRLLIPQSPVAVSFIKQADEPVSEILGSIYDGLVDRLLQEQHSGDAGLVQDCGEFVACLEPTATACPATKGLGISGSSSSALVVSTTTESSDNDGMSNGNGTTMVQTLSLGGDCVAGSDSATTIGRPETSLDSRSWAAMLTGGRKCWLTAVLTEPHIMQGTKKTENYIPRLLQLHDSQRCIQIATPAGSEYPLSLAIVNNASSQPATELCMVFDRATSTVQLEIQLQSRSLCLSYLFSPTTPWALVHEIMDEQRDQRIRSFFKAGSDKNDSCSDARTAVKVTAASVSAFCRANGICLPGYPPNTDEATAAPLDYLSSVIAQPCAFAALVADNFASKGLLGVQLVSADVELAPSGIPIAYALPQIGDTVESTANVIEVSRAASGRKQAVVRVESFGDKQLLATTTVTYEFAGTTSLAESSSELGFRHCTEPEYLVTMQSPEDIAVLESKPWFSYDHGEDSEDGARHALTAGSRLLFRLRSSYKLRPNGQFASAETTGQVYQYKGCYQLEPIGSVSYLETDTLGNPVIGYLQKLVENMDPDHFNPVRPVSVPVHCPLSAGEYSLTPQPLSIEAPDDADAYAAASAALVQMDGLGVLNANRYLSAMSAQSGVLPWHWCATAVRTLIEQYVADSCPQRVLRFTAELAGAVHAGERLSVQLDHVAMCDGDLVINGHAYRETDGISVLRCTAIVAAPPTMYVFTGQGSQEKGMGQDLYKRSPVARAIYDRVEKHLVEWYGFSLLDIMWNNPKQLTVHFGGKQGAKVRNQYMRFRNRVTDPQTGETRVVPLFPEITAASRSYTFSSATGLLHCTQFAQPAIMVFDIAMLSDMRAHGLVQKNSLIGGHSLGEYGSLTAFGIISPEDITEITFIRGMTMQSTVSRDAEHRSEFAMVAANPTRVSSSFTDASLAFVIEAISERHPGKLLEVVNYNVRGYQYVVAGSRPMLAVLSTVLDKLHAGGYNFSAQGWKKKALAFIEQAGLPADSDCYELRKCRATIPIPGIDVPFHSSHLLPGADLFRQAIVEMIKPTDVDRSLFQRRYIPNLNAQFYEISRAYFEKVYQQTRSPVLAHELSKWPEDEAAALESNKVERMRLATLLMTELLAYQFASPVRWIETQEKVFNEMGVQRLIEIGSNATLCRMAEATLKLTGMDTQVVVQHMPRDEDDLYYRTARMLAGQEKERLDEALRQSQQKATEQAGLVEPTEPVEPIKPAKPSQPETAPTALPVLSEPAAAVLAIDDVPLTALDVLRVVIAQKLRCPLNQVPATASLRDLTGGKSTLLNEILGDLLKEFSISAGQQIPDRIDEISLGEVCSGLNLVQPLDALGKHTSAQVARLFSAKMPGSVTISSARRSLDSLHGLSRSHQQDAALLVALTMEPESRVESKEAAASWLRQVVDEYARYAGISLPTAEQLQRSSDGRSGPGSSADGAVVAINSAEFDQMQSKLRRIAEQQIDVYSQYLQSDGDSESDSSGGTLVETGTCSGTSETANSLQDVSAELGQEFIDGIRPLFDARKARRFDSYWNWARQDAIAWINDVKAGSPPPDWARQDNRRRLLQLQNRADPQLVKLLDGLAAAIDKEEGDKSTAKEGHAADLARKLRDSCVEALKSHHGNSTTYPVYRELSQTSQPVTNISTTGKVSYAEITPRPHEPTMADYVDRVSLQPENSSFTPLLHMRRCKQAHNWEYCKDTSASYYTCLRSQCTEGVSYAGTTALITGCSQGSIGAQVLQSLLSGGAYVVATTSSYSKSMPFYEAAFREYGARGSQLVVLPYNQASAQDTASLIDYVYNTLGRNLDYVLPFAALADYSCDVSRLGARSELSLRLLMTNVLRMLGEIKRTKETKQWTAQPTLAVIPLSPNHGDLGFDGLYGESKAALETLFYRWRSESWGSLVTVAGAVIGWTRGTGLMAPNNVAAALLEQKSNGGRTFSTTEMGFNIMGLLHPDMAAMAQESPLWADLNGGLDRIVDGCGTMMAIRRELAAEASKRNAVAMSYMNDFVTTAGHDAGDVHKQYSVEPLFNHKQHFAQPPSFEQAQQLNKQLAGMVNLDKVVVVTGYGEVGPYGSAETRWEMESFGEFSLEGCVELAWVMGLIRHAPDGQSGGWVDAATGEPVADKDIKRRYEPRILEHTGIRLLEAEHMWDVSDPAVIPIMRELQIQHDLPPFEATADEAQQFKLRSGPRVDIWANADGSWSVRFRKGAVLMVPKALRFDRLVGAQLPSGWSPERYGIPKDIVQQVDLVTCYALIGTAEALVRAGITDPYELYSYFHVSQVGTTLGSGAGGVHSIRDLYRYRLMDRPLQSDILQETFANSMAAWINMMLLSSAGPIKPPMGGCATALLSIDVAADTIRQGTARVMIAGAFEGYVDQGSYEFAQMGATGSSEQEMAMGRKPREMSRPATHTRSGFVESQGSGVVVLMSAAAAIEFGAPIYAIIGGTTTATDKQGFSLPAPGMGLLSSTRESKAAAAAAADSCHKQLLDVGYRRKQLQMELRLIDTWAQMMAAESPEDRAMVEQQAERRRRAARDTWGQDFWRHNPHISPLRGALAAWGLTADDLSMASLHGTATYANDLNEANVLDAQLRSLGRTPGHALPAVCQKWLTGHPKGPAAAWMLNGAIQSMRTGLIPGNRNADNIDSELQKEYVFYPSRTFKVPMVKAALLKSYGFGQVGAEMLVIHPHYLFASLAKEQFDEYAGRCGRRELKAYRYWQNVFAGKHPLIQPKKSPPYTPDQEEAVLTDSTARARYDPATNTYHF
ncbi:fatty acid synthase alpha subunit Lsd1 [Coemansia sp. RSA 2599]|nr:fatty acid synthase alpha subunit Lsd1 [Coemansia sp. RSA 2599]